MNKRKERYEVVRDCNNALKIFLNSIDDVVNKFSYNREKTKIESKIEVEQIFNIDGSQRYGIDISLKGKIL